MNLQINKFKGLATARRTGRSKWVGGGEAAEGEE